MRGQDNLDRLRHAAAASIAEFMHLVVISIQVIAMLLAVMLPWTWRFLAVVAPVVAAADAFPRLFRAFGGDPVALFPALALVLLPGAATVALAGRSNVPLWGAFLLAAGLEVLLGRLASAAGPQHMALAVTGAIAFITFYFVTSSGEQGGEP